MLKGAVELIQVISQGLVTGKENIKLSLCIRTLDRGETKASRDQVTPRLCLILGHHLHRSPHALSWLVEDEESSNSYKAVSTRGHQTETLGQDQEININGVIEYFYFLSHALRCHCPMLRNRRLSHSHARVSDQ